MERSIEDVPWYWWLIVVLALLYTTHDVQYRMAENLRLLQNPIINRTYRAVMRMTLNWKDARIFNNSWSSFFSCPWEMKSLHWNGLLSRAYSENWFPQVNKLPWSLVLFFIFLFWSLLQGSLRIRKVQFFLTLFKRGGRGGHSHVQKLCCKFCIIQRALWQHKLRHRKDV